MPSTSRSRFLDFLLIFIGTYLLLQLVMKIFFPAQQGAVQSGLVLSLQQAGMRTGHYPSIVLHNKSASGITLPARCPAPPVDVYRLSATGAAVGPLSGSGLAVPCVASGVTVAPGASATVSLAPWKYALFGEPATFNLELPKEVAAKAGSGAVTHATLTMTQPGTFVQLFRAFVTKPLLNLLVLIASIVPEHDLGVSIILLTVVIKLLLFLPTQHALEGQRKMQLLQPKIEEIKQKHKGDAQAINTETMKLWKENKINPFQSCLPILLQFPVLIGLFYVIRDGSVLSLSREFLYSTYQHVAFHFDTQFLGFDLTLPSKKVFPVLLVVLQFLQMKLSFHIAKRKKGGEPQKTDPATDAQQKVMLYVMPLMIGVFAFQFPTAVSLYWAISTLFGIGQQLVVNRKTLVA